jgi:hypothetical protein
MEEIKRSPEGHGPVADLAASTETIEDAPGELDPTEEKSMHEDPEGHGPVADTRINPSAT